MATYVKFNDLHGRILKDISVDYINNIITFITITDEVYRMEHYQDCCEDVCIEDIIGNPDDLIGLPILLADKSSSMENPRHEHDESFTWTFYRLSTNLGSLTIRWYGSSNGYYSEDVTFYKVENK
jgi:hypothetical protein